MRNIHSQITIKVFNSIISAYTHTTDKTDPANNKMNIY